MPAITATSGMPSPNKPIVVTSCREHYKIMSNEDASSIGLTQDVNRLYSCARRDSKQDTLLDFAPFADAGVRRRLFCQRLAGGFQTGNEDSVLRWRSILLGLEFVAASSLLLLMASDKFAEHCMI